MCIAVVTTPGKRVDKAAMWKGWSSNSDGGGFAFVEDGEVKVRKGFMEYNPFEKAYTEAFERVGSESPFLVHMRIGTSGGVSQNNTHPFYIPKHGAAMIHNGVLFDPAGAWEGPTHDPKSDTRVVAEALGNIFEYEAVLRSRRQLSNAIGYGNKLAFLYPNKEFVIVGEENGWWVDGIWYSNSGCGVTRSIIDPIRR